MKQEPTPVPCSISVCQNGCVILQFGVALIHLEPKSFEAFVGEALRTLARIEKSSSVAHPVS